MVMMVVGVVNAGAVVGGGGHAVNAGSGGGGVCHPHHPGCVAAHRGQKIAHDATMGRAERE